MKYILLLLALVSLPAIAEGPIVDPTRQATKPLTCVLPTEYTDNTPLDPLNINRVNFYRAQAVSGPWTLIGSNLGPICAYTEQVNLLAVGQYYYHATVTDNIGLESGMSNIVPLEVRLSVPPKPPTSLGWAD